MATGYSSPNINNIPIDIMEHLLKYFDGRSLIALGYSCRNWKDFLLGDNVYLLRKWASVCMLEIPVDFLLDILRSIYPKYWVGDNNVYWSDIYISWQFWRTKSQHHFDVSKLCSISDDITSLGFSGEWLFIGTRDIGGLQAINYKTHEKKILINKCGNVKSFYFRSRPEIIASHEYCLSDVEHDEVVVQFQRQVSSYDLLTGTSFPTYHMKDFTQMKHFENHEIKINSRIYQSHIFSKNITSERVSKLVVERCVCTILQIWNGWILLLFDSGRLQVYDYDLHPKDHPINEIKLDTYDIILNKTYYVWHLDVICILGPLTYGDSWVDIIVRGRKRRYFPFAGISAMITAVHYHAGILMTGTDLGGLYIYIVERDEDLLCLDLTEPAHHVQFTDTAIVAITIKDTGLGHPVIGVASTNDIFFITCL